MHPFHRVKPTEVTDRDSLQQFIEQQLGVGYVTAKDQAIFRRKVRDIFEQYPQATWDTLVRTVEWAKMNRRRFSRLHQVVESVRYAFEEGYLPELDPFNESSLDGLISVALQREEDPEWRRRFLVTQGYEAKASLLERWQEFRAIPLTSFTGTV